MLTRVLIIAALALIVITLFSALALLFRSDDDPNKRLRVVKALTLRVSLTMGLLLLVALGAYTGVIPATGLR